MTKNEVSARVHRWLSYFYGAMLFFFVCIFMLASMDITAVWPAILGLGVFIAIHFFTSVGAQKKEFWARGVSIVLGILMLFAFPIGTILGCILLFNSNWNEG
ncbi:hypothetical protein [Undibacterium sp. Tian12W]|uniref:hypothetical protein n=1 Tax=Undibacterium sp. Tian12W TaxID=3413054 RepID=UPI003BF38ECA